MGRMRGTDALAVFPLSTLAPPCAGRPHPQPCDGSHSGYEESDVTHVCVRKYIITNGHWPQCQSHMQHCNGNTS